MTAGPGPGARPPGDLSYAEATAELDVIIAEFDQGQVDVDRLAERFQRATELVEELDRRIRVNRTKVEALTPRLEAVANGQAALPANEEDRAADEGPDPAG